MFVQKIGVKNRQKSDKEAGSEILAPVKLSPTQEDVRLFSSRLVPAMTQSLVNSRRRRIAIYSHDIKGLERTRCNVLIAQILANSPLKVDILMITGSWEASKFSLPPNVDCLTLPALHKTAKGKYQARSLNISLKEITRLRSQLIQAALAGFAPDILIVDKAPRGAMRELDATLTYLRRQGRTRCVLGLPDALDESAAGQRDWSLYANEDAIRDYYDAVWIYGAPTDYGAANAYRFSHAVGAKIRYTGYLEQQSWSQCATTQSMDAPIELALPPSELDRLPQLVAEILATPCS